MRITLTVYDPVARIETDVTLDADPGTPISELESHLSSVASGVTVSEGATVVALDRFRAAGQADSATVGHDTQTATALATPLGPQLYVDGQPLDPNLTLLDSPLREGTLVSVGDPSGMVPPEPDGMAEVRVVGGQGAGVVHRLGIGEAVIGSDPMADIPVAGAAQRAAIVTVNVTGTVNVEPAVIDDLATDDPGDSVAPALSLAREPVTESTEWPVGMQLAVGESLLELAAPERPDAPLEVSDDGVGLDYNRPPRLLPPQRPTKFKLPSEPTEGGKRKLPIISAIAPLVMAVVMVLVFKRYMFLAFGLLSPIVMVGNYLYDKKNKKETFRKQKADYKKQRAEIEADAEEALVKERRARRADAPDPASSLLIAVGPRARLWERRRDDPDFLALRVGTADQPSEVVLTDPSLPEHRREVTWDAQDLPAVIPLGERRVIGVAGQGERPKNLAAWMVAQLAVMHSPRDVRVYVLTEPGASGFWSWARWLPHARPDMGQDTVSLIGTDTETLSRRVMELGAMITARQRATRDARGAQLDASDIVVVLDGARRLRSLPGVVQILKEGPAVGVYSICLDADERLLPEECNAFVADSRVMPGRIAVRQQRADVVDEVRPDVVPWQWFGRVSRALAPVRDVGDDGEEGSIPTACRLLDVVGLDPPTPDAIAGRWVAGGRTTSATVGASLDGPFALDIRKDGPHGLIAGTTGAGKSELLQTIVASLAIANRPDAMTFVLVDYKGGAAFADCEQLPHTVGMVTDLDTHLVERALESLGAELHRREHILADAGAKDIEDYVDMMPKNPALKPMPRCLIVIDEFASMVRELPDFVTGLVNIAQRGRSLGIHLILATQRPSGVVTPEIRANTNLRIALRVTDGAESNDVLDAPDAGNISKSTPGRAYVRLGASSLVPFQSGRVGGRFPGAGTTARIEPFISEIDWSGLGQPAPARPKQKEDKGDVEITDLKVLVEAVQGANEKLGIPDPHRPWLPALPDAMTLDELEEQFPITPVEAPGIPELLYGVADLPAEQDRKPASLDLTTFGHLYVVGSPRSGRSQVLRTMAASIGRHASPADVHVYALDCGNGALLPLAKLPHCGAVVQRTQAERAQRLLGRLSAEIARRQEMLGDGGFADLNEQRRAAAPDERLPHIMLLLDRWEGFTGSLGELDRGVPTDQIMNMLREGASVGVHLIITGDRTLLSSRMSAQVERKLVLRLAERSDYSLASLQPRKMPENIEPGRAFWSESALETQIALVDPDDSGQAQAAAIQRIAEEAAERFRDVPRELRPFRLDVLPSRITFDEVWEKREDDTNRPLWALVGVGGDELLAIGPDMAAGAPTFVVGGPAKSGRSTVLLNMTESLLRQGTEIVVSAPRQSSLRGLEGREGVRAVLTSDELGEDDLKPVLEEGDGPMVWVIDDGEMLRNVDAKDYLRGYIRTLSDNQRAIIIGGDASEVCGGFSGWQVDIKKNRSGALLSPQNTTDGDLVGARLPRSSVTDKVTPGKAMVNLGDGELVLAQVPTDEG